MQQLLHGHFILLLCWEINWKKKHDRWRICIENAYMSFDFMYLPYLYVYYNIQNKGIHIKNWDVKINSSDFDPCAFSTTYAFLCVTHIYQYLDTTPPKAIISPFVSRTVHHTPEVLTKNQNPDHNQQHRLWSAYEVWSLIHCPNTKF